MLTQQDKMDMFQMKLSGHTYEAIGKRYGVSKQAVHQILHDAVSDRRRKVRSVFPGLNMWMYRTFNNGKTLYDMCGLDISYSVFQRKLVGHARLTMDEIRAILRVTHLTFEEAFGVEETLTVSSPGKENASVECQ